VHRVINIPGSEQHGGAREKALPKKGRPLELFLAREASAPGLSPGIICAAASFNSSRRRANERTNERENEQENERMNERTGE
jgi:hypothetical protein